MEKETWKIIAIIFTILFILETSFLAYSVVLVTQEEADIKECYYDLCKDYPDAYYEGGVCACYDNYGGLTKTEVIK